MVFHYDDYTLVIADGRFPYWPQIETVDLSLVDDIPTVCQVLQAVVPNFQLGQAWMASQFLEHNSPQIQQEFSSLLGGTPIAHEPHDKFKERVPRAIGLIRTGDTLPYANIILESA